ncbi:MAG: hypothetical protein CHACPFDD_02062 [Phycisphaerae bacterium]|nr:hypothetical protein [Phycisphaerae bacterium]
MISQLPSAPVRRVELQRKLDSRDLYGFLAGVESYLAAVPEDAAMRGAAAQVLALLGLSSAARQVWDQAAPGTAVTEELRTALATPDARVAWSSVAGQFNANLPAFERRTGLGETVSDAWRRHARQLQLFRCRDGNYQVLGPEGWLPALFPHRQSTDAAALRTQWRGQFVAPIVVAGLGLGNAAHDILSASASTFLTYSAPVCIVEPSLLAWAVVLHLHEWSALFEQPRLTIAAGAEAMRVFRATLEDVERRLPVVISGGPRWPDGADERAIEQAANAARESRSATLRGLAAAAIQRYAGVDERAWARRFARAGDSEPPLRILGITSRFTTVLQYTMRDLLAALATAGATTDLFIEADDHAHFSPISLLRRIDRFRPDLIITIDHLRREFAEAIPPSVPSLCWIQDHLPHLFSRDAGAGVGPLEYVCGYGHLTLLTQFGYPSDRFYPCDTPTDPRQLLDERETPSDLEPYRCDVMFVTHAPEFDSPAARHEHHRAALSPADRRVFDAAYETLRAALASPDFGGEYDEEHLLTQAEAACGAPASNADLRADMQRVLGRIADQTLREDAILGAARWADATGGSFFLYGNGWDGRPALARFARGPIQHGPALGRAYRAARINLHAGCNYALHRRVLDGLCAGAFFLIADKPSDRLALVWDAVYAAARQKAAGGPVVILPDDLPTADAARFSDYLTRIGRDPRRGFEIDQRSLLYLRLQCELRWTVQAAHIWPRYEQVVFRGSEQLAERIAHFVQRDDERRALAAEMRQAVMERFTYDGFVRRLLAWLRESLAQQRRSLLPPTRQPAPGNTVSP